MGREENVKIFQDTERIAKTNKRLIESVKESTRKQILIPEYMNVSDFMEISSSEYNHNATVIVSKKRSYEAASAYNDKVICVHNFASATNPGGGVVFIHRIERSKIQYIMMIVSILQTSL